MASEESNGKFLAENINYFLYLLRYDYSRNKQGEYDEETIMRARGIFLKMGIEFGKTPDKEMEKEELYSFIDNMINEKRFMAHFIGGKVSIVIPESKNGYDLSGYVEWNGKLFKEVINKTEINFKDLDATYIQNEIETVDFSNGEKIETNVRIFNVEYKDEEEKVPANVEIDQSSYKDGKSINSFIGLKKDNIIIDSHDALHQFTNTLNNNINITSERASEILDEYLVKQDLNTNMYYEEETEL